MDITYRPGELRNPDSLDMEGTTSGSAAQDSPLHTSPPQKAAARPAEFHGIVKKVFEATEDWLLEQFSAIFADVDDTLFTMAEKAQSQADQDTVFADLRTLRMEKTRLVETVISQIRERFHRPQEPRSSIAAEEVPTGELSLVQDADLEQEVIVKSLVSNASRDLMTPIAELSLRLDSLLPGKVYDENLPIGPAILCERLIDSMQPLSISLKTRLVFLKKFEKQMMLKLGELYETCNSALVNAGVLPSLKNPHQRRQSPGSNTARANAAKALAKALGVSPDGDGQFQVPALPGFQAALASMEGGAVQGAAGQGGAGQGGGFGFVPGLMPVGQGAPQLPTQNLLQFLGELQFQIPQMAQPEGQVLDINAVLTEQLVTAKRSASLGKLDNEVIRLVDMLFSFVLEDRNLADPIKAQLVRLQLPFLKIAVADKAFFAKAGHPARKLLNEVADAAIGWQLPEDYENDPLFKAVREVVETVIAEFDSDQQLFEKLLQEFRAYCAREKKRASMMERRTVEDIEARARLELGRKKVCTVIDAILKDRQLPDFVERMLNTEWRNLLLRTCLQQGTGSTAWRDRVAIARDLAWSVTAPMPQATAQIAKLKESLLGRIKVELHTLSLKQGDKQQFLDQLEFFYVSRAEASKEDVVPQPVREVKPVPEAKDIEQLAEKATLKPTPEPRKVEVVDKYWQQTMHLKNSWFRLSLPEKPSVRCRLVAMIKDTDQFMFANRNGTKAAVYSRLEFAQALHDGILEPLENGPLFERALKYVVGNIGETELKIAV